MLHPHEDYERDEASSDRIIRFFQNVLRHYEGEFAGQLFKLADPQIEILTNIYGWRHKVTGLRRVTDVWFEAAAGAGKSPFLGGIGIYELVAGSEPAAQIYSVAANYKQARVVFDWARAVIETNRALSQRLKITQYEISNPATKSFWRIISGKTPAAGARPSILLADELWQWDRADVYHDLRRRMIKRREPLSICATNAGTDRQSFAFKMHEQAVEVAEGKRHQPSLYPVIWAAPADAAPGPDAWRAANKLLDITIKQVKVADEWEIAKGDPESEARHKQLYLGHWTAGATQRWIDCDQWHALHGTWSADDIKNAVLYGGADISQHDDISAVALVWLTPNVAYVRCHGWIPKATAERYESRYGHAYESWKTAGNITLINGPTVTDDIKRQMAQWTLDQAGKTKIQAIAFDRYKADAFVDALELKKVICVRLPQGFSLTPGCDFLARKMAERSIVIEPNGMLDAHAQNVEIKPPDDRGNYWPVKPGARNAYAGKRGVKIDGIVALVNALTEARKWNFAKPTLTRSLLLSGKESKAA